jgi:AmmeMemoRadiSam system protein B
MDAYQKRKISSCGAGCAAALVSLLSEYSAEILDRGDSTAEHNAYDKLVCYAGISFFKKD